MQTGDWAYYHAFYNALAHAAAYVATFVLLVTAGIVVSTSQHISNRWYLRGVIMLAGIAACYFLARWYKFSLIVNDTLGQAATNTVWIGPGWLAIIGTVVTLVVVVSDLVVLKRNQ